jgi:hypothetical protein
VEVQLHVFSTSTPDGSDWSASRPGNVTPVLETPDTHWAGGCVGPTTGLDAVAAPATNRTRDMVDSVFFWRSVHFTDVNSGAGERQWHLSRHGPLVPLSRQNGLALPAISVSDRSFLMTWGEPPWPCVVCCGIYRGCWWAQRSGVARFEHRLASLRLICVVILRSFWLIV